MTTETGDGRDDVVRSVDRALELLDRLSEHEDGQRLTDLAKRTDLPVSTVHRLLLTLERRGFATFDAGRGRWHVGRQAFAVGASFARRGNFVAQAISHLRLLRNQTRETVNFGMVENGRIVLLAQAESRQVVRAIARVGGTVSLTRSGMGKAVLAASSRNEIEHALQMQPLQPLTPHSIVRRSDYFSELDASRARGYAVDREEFVSGLCCVATAVSNEPGDAVFGLSVSGLAERMPEERLHELGSIISDAATRLHLAASAGR